VAVGLGGGVSVGTAGWQAASISAAIKQMSPYRIEFPLCHEMPCRSCGEHYRQGCAKAEHRGLSKARGEAKNTIGVWRANNVSEAKPLHSLCVAIE